MSTAAALLVLTATWAGALLGAAVPTSRTSHGVLPALLLGVGVGLVAVASGLVVALVRRGSVSSGPVPSGGGSTGELSTRVLVTPRSVRCRAVLAVGLVLVTLVSGAGAHVRAVSVQQGGLAGVILDPSPAPDRQGDGVAIEADLVTVSDVRDPSVGSPWVLGRLTHVAQAGHPPVRSRERVQLRLPPDARTSMGATYRVRGVASPIDGDAARWFARLGVVVTIDAFSVDLAQPPPVWHRLTTGLRERVGGSAHARLPPAEASLLTGLVTGDLRGQPEEVADDVSRSGLSHLVAVSGSNVALVAGATMGLVLLLGRGRRAGWMAALAVIWWFVVLVRAEPSVVRAAVMATLVLCALLVGRVRSTPHLLCTAGTLALLADPLLAGRLGFVLSMAATAGVVLLMPPIDAVLADHTPLPGPVRRVLAATCGAQLAVAPILLVADGDVHVASVGANLVAVPAAGAAGMVGTIMAVLSWPAPDASSIVALLARPALQVVLWSARTFAGDAARSWAVRCVWLLAVPVVLALVRRGLARSSHGPVLSGGLSVLLIVVVLAGPWGVVARPGGSALPEHPVMVVLDVGQGDAILLADPEVGWILVDGGPDPALVLRHLEDRGITELVAVVATHPHADHTDGLEAVVEVLPVGTVVTGPRGEEARGLLTAAGRAGVAVVEVAAGTAWDVGQLVVRVLSPPATGLGAEPNENSLVLRVDVAEGRSVLLTGDAEVVAQTRLMDDALIDVDVLKVPHHGGATNAVGFLAATTPDVAVISAGEDNSFGHPHPDVLADLAGVEVRRTDVDGDIVVPLR